MAPRIPRDAAALTRRDEWRGDSKSNSRTTPSRIHRPAASCLRRSARRHWPTLHCVFHVELRQRPNMARAFNLSEEEVIARFLKPLMAGRPLIYEDRD